MTHDGLRSLQTADLVADRIFNSLSFVFDTVHSLTKGKASCRNGKKEPMKKGRRSGLSLNCLRLESGLDLESPSLKQWLRDVLGIFIATRPLAQAG